MYLQVGSEHNMSISTLQSKKQKIVVVSTTGVDGILSAYAMRDVFSVSKTIFVNPYDNKDVVIKTKGIENESYPVFFLGFSMQNMPRYKTKCFSILFSPQSTPSIQQITPHFCSITACAHTCAESLLHLFGAQFSHECKTHLQGYSAYRAWLQTRDIATVSSDSNAILKGIAYETIYELLGDTFLNFLKQKNQEQFNNEINTFYCLPHTVWHIHLLQQIKIASALRQKETSFINSAGDVKRFPQGKNNIMTPLGVLLYFKGFPQHEFPELKNGTTGILYDRKHKHVWIHTPCVTNTSVSMLEYFFRPLKMSFFPPCGFPPCDVIRGILPSSMSLEKVHTKIDKIIHVHIQKERENTSSELSGMDLGV